MQISEPRNPIDATGLNAAVGVLRTSAVSGFHPLGPEHEDLPRSRSTPELWARQLQSIPPMTKWSWACRGLELADLELEPPDSASKPNVGDVALVRIESMGYHASLVMRDNRKLRIYPGDYVVGVFGHRYATDAYEAEVDGLDDLSLLTAGGMIGTVRSRHRDVAKPTLVTFLGYLVDGNRARLNLKQARFRAVTREVVLPNLIVVVGTGMNAGKTTVASQLIHSLTARGLRVAACKLTGSVSNRDQDEMRAASACSVLDFSDYGFPSTYLASLGELRGLTNAMFIDTARSNPEITVLEIADGLLQRETAMILSDPSFHRRVSRVLLAADSALSALAAVDRLRELDYPIAAVSGAFTSSPLYVKEFTAHSNVPVVSSADGGSGFGNAVAPHLLRRSERPIPPPGPPSRGVVTPFAREPRGSRTSAS